MRWRLVILGVSTGISTGIWAAGMAVAGEVDLTGNVQKYPIVATGVQWPDHWVARGIVGQSHPSVRDNPELATIPEYADFVAGTENPPRPEPGSAGGGFWPVLTRLRDPDTDEMTDRLACLFRTGAIHLGPGGNVAVAFSDDRGQTWTDPTVVVPYDEDLLCDVRHGSFGQAPNGDLLVMDWVSQRWDWDLNDTGGPDFYQCRLWRSTDMGQTWNGPQVMDFDQRLGFGVGSYGPIHRIDDETLVVNIRDGETDKSFLAWSHDNGHTWPEITTVSTDRKTETYVLPLEEDTWIGYVRQGAGGAWICRSNDGGKTWPEWEEIQPYSRRVPGCIVKLPQDDTVAVIHTYRQYPFGIRAFLSHDGGQTFDTSTSYVLSDTAWNEDSGYPSAVVYEDGTVVVAAYTTKDRDHPEWGTCAEALVFNSWEPHVEPFVWQGVIPLGNLFDDPESAPLLEGLATDTLAAGAHAGGLGVYSVVSGDNTGVQTIVPGISFDFTNLEGGTSSAKEPGNDALLGAGSGTAVALRITGEGPQNGGAALPASKVREGIGLTSETRLVFDLDEIRAAGELGAVEMEFSAVGAVNDSMVGHTSPLACQFHMLALVMDENEILSAVLNGQEVNLIESDGTWSIEGPLPEHFVGNDTNGDGLPDGLTQTDFFLEIPATARYLALISVDDIDGTGNYADHSVWIDAQLRVIEPGDLNGDGFVGSGDLDIVRSFWGQAVTPGDLLSGDPSGDGLVGSGDLDIIRANWGRGIPADFGIMPEPTTVWLILIGGLPFVISNRYR